MHPRKPKHYKRPPIIKEFREEQYNDSRFWILFHYGKSYFNKVKNRIYRKSYFKTAPKNKTFHIENWDVDDKLIQIEIPEEHSYYYSIGSVFNHKGKFLKPPITSKKDRIYELSNIRLSYKKTTGIKDLLNS